MTDGNVSTVGMGSLAPGVVFDTRPARPAAVFRTGVPLFVGFAQSKFKKGEAKRRDADVVRDEVGAEHVAHAGIVELSRWDQFHNRFSVDASGYLAYAVRGFFENGGRSCYVLALDDKEMSSAQSLEKLFAPEPPAQWSPQKIHLEEMSGADLVSVPDIMCFQENRETVVRLQNLVLDYCQRVGTRFAILDAFPAERSHGQLTCVLSSSDKSDEARFDIDKGVAKHRRDVTHADGALYFPWIRVEPMTVPSLIASDKRKCLISNVDFLAVPPCGHVAGIYARSDARTGVHKAPANEVVRGAVDLTRHVDASEHALLNDIGVNCLRSLPGRGVRLWGARSLGSTSAWQYVHVRRLFITLTRWIEQNMSDLVFEPNDEALWASIRSRLGSYCYSLFRQRALKGRDPSEAYFVKCDAETNISVQREHGRVVAEVGLAPITTAEFIVVRIAHDAASTAITYLPDRA